jgi:hypothetical protein
MTKDEQERRQQRREHWLTTTGLLPPDERPKAANEGPEPREPKWWVGAKNDTPLVRPYTCMPVDSCLKCGARLVLSFVCYTPKLCDSCAANHGALTDSRRGVASPVRDFDDNGSYNASSFDDIIRAYEEDR